MEDIRKRLQSINAALDGISLVQRGNKLYMRAMLPHKDGSNSHKRYELKIGCPATRDGLKIAAKKAGDLSSLLLSGLFTWQTWETGKSKDRLTTGEWIDLFETAHWKKVQKTPNRERNWAVDYTAFFHLLLTSEPLTLDMLRKVAMDYSNPTTRKRQKICNAYNALARFAGIEGSLSDLAKGYKPKVERILPTVGQIEAYRGKFSDPFWRWGFSMIACFGLRPHEIFHVNLSRLPEETPILEVTGGKTGARQVLPMPRDCRRWVVEWALWEQPQPSRKINTDRPNSDLGHRVSQSFRRSGIGITPYYLRDWWAVQCAVEGIDVSIAARMMGHSLKVHYDHYQSHIDERHYVSVFKQHEDSAETMANLPGC
ncbi:MAG: site-specific integrase [Cyanobacteria bacterium P01_G01_bin.54]